MAASDGLPPLGLDRLQAERMFQHLLRTVLSVADAGGNIQGRSWSELGLSGGRTFLVITGRPGLQTWVEAENFDPANAPTGVGRAAPLPGTGFSMHLVRNTPGGGGGE